MWKKIVPLAVVAALIVVFAIGLTRNPSELPSPLIGQLAPAFDLADIYAPQERVTSELLKGDYVLVNVWATWCPPCHREHPYLLELANQGVKIVGINWQDQRGEALRWLREFGDPYIAVGSDPIGRAGIDWGVYGAPETFLVDPNGVVLHKHISELTPAVWANDFLPLIEEGQ